MMIRLSFLKALVAAAALSVAPAFVHMAGSTRTRSPVGILTPQFRDARWVQDTDVLTIKCSVNHGDGVLSECDSVFVVGTDVPSARYYGCAVVIYNDGSSSVAGLLDTHPATWVST